MLVLPALKIFIAVKLSYKRVFLKVLNLFKIGTHSCPFLNSALLHSIAIRLNATQVGLFNEYVAATKLIFTC